MAESQQPPAPSKALVFARRSGSTVFLWGLIAAIFLSHRSWAMLALVAALGIVASAEFFQMLRSAGVKCFPRFGMVVAAAYTGGVCWIFWKGADTLPGWLDAAGVFAAIAGPFFLQLRYPIRGIDPLIAVASNLLGFVYIAFLFNFASRVTFLAPGANAVPGLLGASGSFLLLWLLAVTKFTDMGAYITGSLFGRHKMIPHVSPGKTWEGFAGALLFSQLAACGLYAIFSSQLACLGGWSHVIFLGFLLSILAVAGDLAESVVKRSLSAKDSGKMLPGIGGALDLIDSVCFTAPALYFYLKWVLLPA